MTDLSEEQIQKIIQKIPNPKPRSEFLEQLGDAIETRSELFFDRHKKQNKGILNFFSWQLSLALTSIAFILMIGTVVFISPTTRDKISSYLNQEAKSSFSDEVELTVNVKNGNAENLDIFVFNLLEENSTPLNVPVKVENDALEFNLYPGQYRLVFVEEGKPVVEEEILIENGQSDVIIDLEL